MLIKNREEIIEQLTEMLIQFDKDCNTYQTDVYLYYDKENQTAKLDTFVNVGGNSWLDDDHYIIYRDSEHYETFWNWYQDSTEFANALDLDNTELEFEVRQALDIDVDCEVDWHDCRDYLKQNDEYVETLQAIYNDYLDELRSDYIEKAELIMDRFDEEMEIQNIN